MQQFGEGLGQIVDQNPSVRQNQKFGCQWRLTLFHPTSHGLLLAIKPIKYDTALPDNEIAEAPNQLNPL
jgi:hypothetical protein